MSSGLTLYTPEKIRQRKKLPDWVFDVLQIEDKFHKFWITKGLGSGGTYGAAMWHYIMCQINSSSRASWSVAPTFTQVIDPLIPTFIEVLTKEFGLVEGTDFEVITSNFPRIKLLKSKQDIFFKSASSPHRLVGANISHASGTEIGLWKNSKGFEKTFNRIRCPYAKRLQFLGEGSPEGLNWWSVLANFTPGTSKKRNSTRIILETDDNPYLPEGYIENNLEQIYAHDPIKLESYRFGRFVEFQKGTAYWNYKDRHPIVTLGLRADPALPLVWAWDFNRSPLAWVVLQRGYFERRGLRYPKYRIIAESSGTSKGLMEATAEFMVRFPSAQWGQHRIEIYGDASGYAGSHKTPLCDYSQIEQYLRESNRYTKVNVLAAKKNPDVRPRLERVNALFAFEMVEIDASCNRLRQGLVRTALKEGTWDIEKPANDTWSHYPDGMGYALYALSKGDELEMPNAFKVWGMSTR